MVKNAIKFTPLMDSLPSSVPFVGPETQERFRSSKFLARLGANENVFGPSPDAIKAMQQESTDLIGAHTTYGSAVRIALSNAQLLLGDLEAAQLMESIYGALVAYSQQVMIRMRAGGTPAAA